MDSEAILSKLTQRMDIEGYAPNTIRSYREYVKLFLQHMHKYAKLEAVPEAEIEAFIKLKLKTDQHSVSYQRALLGAIRKLYELLLNQNLKLNHLYPKRQVSALPTFFSKNEIRLLLEASENLKHKALLMCIYGCGLRLSELLNLKVKDFNFPNQQLIIEQSRGHNARTVALPDILLQTLEDYKQEYLPTDYLFEGADGGRYSERSVQLILKKALLKSGIEKDGTVHSLRHSYAAHLIQSGLPVAQVQELMGHASIKTTQLYLQLADGARQRNPSPLDFI